MADTPGTADDAGGSRGRWTGRARVAAACIAAGVLIGLALPPWGWWPLAFGGVAVMDRLLAHQPRIVRFRRMWLVAAAWLFPTLSWMATFTLPGYLIASVIYSAYFGLAAAAPPADRWRWVGLPGAIVLAEIVRWSFPFGGVPLSTFAMGQVGGPLAPLARLGGGLLIVLAVVTVGLGISALAAPGRRGLVPGLAMVAAPFALALVGAVAPDGEPVGELDVALVQGGGEQGTTADETDPREVFERHVAATRLVTGEPDLILWPEDVVDVDGPLQQFPEGGDLAALAGEMDRPIVAGIVEGVGHDRFRNAAQVINVDGTLGDRYEKVVRVPFGEYLPLRSVIERVADTDLLPRDAIAGTGPAVVDTPSGRLGVVISWEVFFGRRARDAVRNGGEIIYNPTNGASYEDIQVQAQQVASSRLRAIETGRWVLQVAPTGFTAVVDPSGDVLERTRISEQRVVPATVELREGQTVYTRFGDGPLVALALALLAAALLAPHLPRDPHSHDEAIHGSHDRAR